MGNGLPSDLPQVQGRRVRRRGAADHFLEPTQLALHVGDGHAARAHYSGINWANPVPHAAAGSLLERSAVSEQLKHLCAWRRCLFNGHDENMARQKKTPPKLLRQRRIGIEESSPGVF
jgi:hypothetical protein